MGDMADMTLQDSVDGVAIEEDSGNYFGRDRECAYCGKKQLEWRKTEHGWRLIEPDGKIHVCGACRKASLKKVLGE